MRTVLATTTMLAGIVVGPSNGHAFHRQTPPLIELTTSGDNVGPLPRIHPEWYCPLVLPIDTANLDPRGYFQDPTTAILTPPGERSLVRQNWFRKEFQLVTTGGDAADPTLSTEGGTVAWDADCTAFQNDCEPGSVGRQIFRWQLNEISQVTHDPTGTCSHPAIDGRGRTLAFDSQGDLTNTGTAGNRQIFVQAFSHGRATVPLGLTQLTQGAGTSQKPILDLLGRNLVFESTNDPNTGADTGIMQVWLSTQGLPAEPVTRGAGPSDAPDMSSDGRVIVFESTAALTGDGHDTGVSQIFTYDTQTRTIAQITNDPQGCIRPVVHVWKADWRTAYICHGNAYFTLVAAKQQFKLPIPDGGDTVQVLTLENNFMVVATTTGLTGGAPQAQFPHTDLTPGHQLYLMNIFKLPATPVVPPAADTR